MTRTTWLFDIEGSPHRVSLTHRGWSSKRVVELDDDVSVMRQRLGLYKGSRDVFIVDGVHEVSVLIDVPPGFVGYQGESLSASSKRYMRGGSDGTGPGSLEDLKSLYDTNFLYGLEIDGEKVEPTFIHRRHPLGKLWHVGAFVAVCISLCGLGILLLADAAATQRVEGTRHSCVRDGDVWSCRLSYEFSDQPYNVGYRTSAQRYDGKEDTRSFFIDPDHPERYDPDSGPEEQRNGAYCVVVGLAGLLIYTVRSLSRPILQLASGP